MTVKNQTQLNKFKTNSYCVGGRHHSGTTNIHPDISAKGTKMLKGTCTKCKRNKSMTVSDQTIAAEGLGDFFKNVYNKAKPIVTKVGKNILSNPQRAFELGTQIGMAAATKNPAALATLAPQLSTFYKTGKGVSGKGLYLGKYK